MRRRAFNMAELVNGRVRLAMRSCAGGAAPCPLPGRGLADQPPDNADRLVEEDVPEVLAIHLARMIKAYQSGQSDTSAARTRLGEARVILENVTAADQAVHDPDFVEAAARLTKAHILSLLSRSRSART